MTSHAAAADLESWLLGDWKSSGPTVCLLVGESGVGKTTLARRVRAAWPNYAVEVSVADDGLDLDDLLLDIAAALEDEARIDFDPEKLDLETGLIDVLRDQILVVIEEFDRTLDASRMPSRRVLQFIQTLSESSLDGRLLLVSSQMPADGPWLESVAIRRLKPPEECDAISILSNLLGERGLESEVPGESRGDVVRWLGNNPRALRALVGCLQDEPLEDLISLNNDAWELRDSAVSGELVRQLERAFIDRTFGRLDGSAVLLAELLSVYRRPFTRDAMDRLADLVTDPTTSREVLASRFMLGHNGRWYALHPVVREIARSRLLLVERRRVAAHRRAADHYGRHFSKAERPERLVAVGEAFVEARFHLTKCGSEAEFEKIASDYRQQLLSVYGRVSKVPDDSSQVNQLIAILRSALANEDNGYSRLRALMAKLLAQRGRAEDKIFALRQATIATRESRDVDVWVIRLRLAWELEGYVAAQAAVQQAVDVLSPNVVWRIYHFHAAEAHSSGRTREALNVLDEAIENMPSKHLSPLYSIAAFILTRAGRVHDAITLLLSGYKRLGPQGRYSYRLYEQGLFLAESIDDAPAMRSLRAEVDVTQAPSQAVLADLVLQKTARRYRQAAEIGEGNLSYPAVAAQTVFCWLCCRDVARAAEAAIAGSLADNAAATWLRALLALCEGKLDLYSEELGATGYVKPAGAGIDEAAWLRVWLDRPARQSTYPGFYFPCLPADLTGLDFDLHHADLDSLSLDSGWWTRIRLPSRAVESVAGLGLSESVAQELSPTVHISGSIDTLQLGGSFMAGDSNVVHGGQVGAMGSSASTTSSTFTQNAAAARPEQTDLAALAAELEVLRMELRRRAETAEADIAVGEIAHASVAAAEGDEVKARSHLAKAGDWALTTAEAIGVGLAVAAIKTALGL